MLQLRSSRFSLLLPLALVAMVACDDENPVDPDPNDPDPPTVSEIRLAEDSLGLYAGESVALGAVAHDEEGAVIEDAVITWSIADPDIVSIDSNGTLTALAQGTTTITATLDDLDVTAHVRVTDFVEISALFDPVCARDVEGAVYCIGTEWMGQVVWPHPLYETWTKISGDLEFTSLTSGYHFTCGMAGDAYCWGSNEDLRSGNGAVMFSSSPLPVTDQPDLVFIDAGATHSCGLDAGGNAYCWGRGDDGQLGNGELESSAPAPVDAELTWLDIDAGDRASCGIGSDGVTYCWGWLRGLVDENAASPVAIDSLPASLERIRVDLEACGSIGADIYCWGPEDQEPTPAHVTMPDDVADFQIGDQSVCALLDNGDIYCWGSNADDLLGDPSLASSATPVKIDVAGRKFVALTGEWSMHCALAVDGGVYCWGGGSFIDRPFTHTAVPTRVPAPKP